MQDLCERSLLDIWWIGANDTQKEGDYRWLNGEPVAADVFSWFTGMYILKP